MGSKISGDPFRKRQIWIFYLLFYSVVSGDNSLIAGIEAKNDRNLSLEKKFRKYQPKASVSLTYQVLASFGLMLYDGLTTSETMKQD